MNTNTATALTVVVTLNPTTLLVAVGFVIIAAGVSYAICKSEGIKEIEMGTSGLKAKFN